MDAVFWDSYQVSCKACSAFFWAKHCRLTWLKQTADTQLLKNLMSKQQAKHSTEARWLVWFDDRLHEKHFWGQVKGRYMQGWPRSSLNDVGLQCQQGCCTHSCTYLDQNMSCKASTKATPLLELVPCIRGCPCAEPSIEVFNSFLTINNLHV